MAVSPRAARIVLRTVALGGVPAVIATSIADSTGAAVTLGLVAAVAALGLILVTAVAEPGAGGAEALGEAVEAQITALVDGGADEGALRRLVGDAVDLGRSRPIR